MTRTLLQDARQRPLFDEVERTIIQYRSASMAWAVPFFNEVGCTILKICDDLEAAHLRARALANQRDRRQGAFEVDAADTAKQIALANAWIEELFEDVENAVTQGVTAAVPLFDALNAQEVSADTYMDARNVVANLIDLVVEHGDHRTFLLADDFIERGRAIHTTTIAERSDQSEHDITRRNVVQELHVEIDKMVEGMLRIARALKPASRRARREIAGFDLSLITGGASRRPTAPVDDSEDGGDSGL